MPQDEGRIAYLEKLRSGEIANPFVARKVKPRDPPASRPGNPRAVR